MPGIEPQTRERRKSWNAPEARLCRGDQPQQLRNEWCMEIIQRGSAFGRAAADPARRGTQPRSGICHRAVPALASPDKFCRPLEALMCHIERVLVKREKE
jgi:hypothetical protein